MSTSPRAHAPDSSASTGRALVQLAIVIIAPSLGALSALWLWPGPVGGGVYAACKAVLYGVPLWVLWKRLGTVGLLCWPFSRASGTVVVTGLASGVLIGVGIWLLWTYLLSSRVDPSPLVDVMLENGMANPLKFWAFAAWLCLGNSLLEEVVFRWYVDTRLEKLGLSIAPVLLVSASIFTAHHVIVLGAYFDWPMVALGSAGVFIGGVVWSLFRIRFSTVLPGWISHALVDVAVVVVGWSILGSDAVQSV